MAFVVPALPSTDYLVHLTKDWARFSFADSDVASASMRRAGVIDLLRAIERPRVISRIRLSIHSGFTVRPLLRGIGPAGRVLAKTMRALTLWGFGLNSQNLQRTPELLSDFDAAAIAEPLSRLPGKPRFAIALHLFYEDLWPEFSAFLGRIRQPFHLIVTTPLPDPVLGDKVRRVFAGAKVITLPNRGRDIGPFLHLLNEGELDGFEFILKLHGKRTAPSGYGAALGHVWRRASLIDLIGSDATVIEILKRFDARPDVGMIGPGRFRLPGRLMPPAAAWGANHEAVLALLARLGENAANLEPDFFAGSMFWVRREVLDPLRKLNLAFAEFPNEQGQRDGELQHALERLFGALPAIAGQRLDDAPPQLCQ